MRYRLIHVRCILKLPILIDPLLDEDLLQRSEEERLLLLLFLDLQLSAQQAQRAIRGMAQHIANGQEVRLVILNHAAVGRDVDLAIGEGIKRINRLIRRDTRCQVHQDLYLLRRVVVHLLDFDLTLVVGLQDALDHG